METKVSQIPEFTNYYLSEFNLFDGEDFITFNIVDINAHRGEITVAVTDRGRISVITFDLLCKGNRYYFEYGVMCEKIAVDGLSTSRGTKDMYPDKTQIITMDNVRELGEIVATCALKAVFRISNSQTVYKLYYGLIQDRYHLHDVNHTFSDGYDLAQTAICFLCGYIGKTLGDNAGTGTENSRAAVTIERACYRAVSRCINREHRTGLRTVCFDDWNRWKLPCRLSGSR